MSGPQRMSFGSLEAGGTVSLVEGAEAVELGVFAGAVATIAARTTEQRMIMENLVE